MARPLSTLVRLKSNVRLLTVTDQEGRAEILPVGTLGEIYETLGSRTILVNVGSRQFISDRVLWEELLELCE